MNTTDPQTTNPKHAMIEMLLAEDAHTIASVAKAKHKHDHLGCAFEPRLARDPGKRLEPTCPGLEERFEDTVIEAAEELLKPAESRRGTRRAR